MTRRFLILVSAFLLAADISARADATSVPLVKSAVLENDIAYLRVNVVGENLAAAISAAENASAVTNKMVGTILDLRFADGDDVAAAKTTADFLAAKKSPLAILVNGATRGAADKLALDLRAAHAGLIFGGAPVDLQPDVAVEVKPADEEKFLKNPYLVLTQNESNFNVTTNHSGFLMTNNFASLIDHTSEADLVREKIKDGSDEEDDTPIARPLPPRPVIRDPALARAVDFLKALAVLPTPRG